MKFAKDEIVSELEYIDSNYDFSEDCLPELKSYLFTRGLIEDVDGSVVTTTEGDLLLGYDKEELRDRYDDEFDRYKDDNFFQDGEFEDDNF